MYQKNFSIIPLNGKMPMIQWEKFQSSPFPADKMQGYIENGCNSFGLVCGYNNVECIDIDTKVLPIESQNSFNEDFLKNIPKAIRNKLMVQKTLNNGLHLIYQTKNVDRNTRLATKGKLTLIETRGKGGYVVIHPSPGYMVINGNIQSLKMLSEQEKQDLFEYCKTFSDHPRMESKANIQYKPSTAQMELFHKWLKIIEENEYDLTADYNDWIKIGFIMANTFGKEGEQYFVNISRHYPNFDEYETREKYNNLLNGGEKGIDARSIRLGAFFRMCKENGLEIIDDKEDKVSQLYFRVLEFLKTKKIRFNTFVEQYEIDEKRIEDKELNTIWADLREKGISVSQNYIMSLIESNRTDEVDPVREYLESLKDYPCHGDEIDRLFDSININNVSDEEELFLFNVMTKWLIQIPAMVYHREVPRLVLVLIGESMIGKSTFFRKLFPKELSGYYAESNLNREKDSRKLMCDKLLINNDEFGGIMRHNQMEEFKHLSSAVKFDERMPYKRLSSTIIRKAVLCGTSNRGDIISDHTTGNTRIIPIELEGQIDRDKFNSLDKKALLACIMAKYKELEAKNPDLSFEEGKALAIFSKKFMTVNFEQEIINECFESGEDLMSSAQIAKYLTDIYPGKLWNQKKIAQEMKRMNFRQKRDNGSRKWMVKIRRDISAKMGMSRFQNNFN